MGAGGKALDVTVRFLNPRNFVDNSLALLYTNATIRYTSLALACSELRTNYSTYM
jgi:hypothetical protein